MSVEQSNLSNGAPASSALPPIFIGMKRTSDGMPKAMPDDVVSAAEDEQDVDKEKHNKKVKKLMTNILCCANNIIRETEGEGDLEAIRYDAAKIADNRDYLERVLNKRSDENMPETPKSGGAIRKVDIDAKQLNALIQSKVEEEVKVVKSQLKAYIRRTMDRIGRETKDEVQDAMTFDLHERIVEIVESHFNAGLIDYEDDMGVHISERIMDGMKEFMDEDMIKVKQAVMAVIQARENQGLPTTAQGQLSAVAGLLH